MARTLFHILKRVWSGPFTDELTDPFARVNRDNWQLGLGLVAGMIVTISVALIMGVPS
tara:strand:+ start:5067 stop:5240 length:174 start_codon:yes stop_codon:yes gene_type:complete